MKEQITRPEVKFWLTIAGIVLTGIIAFVRLQEQVTAMTEREQMNKQTFLEQIERDDANYETLLDVQERVIKIEKDIEYIRLNIN